MIPKLVELRYFEIMLSACLDTYLVYLCKIISTFPKVLAKKLDNFEQIRIEILRYAVKNSANYGEIYIMLGELWYDGMSKKR